MDYYFIVVLHFLFLYFQPLLLMWSTLSSIKWICHIPYGVPQDFVLAPLLFRIYCILPLGVITYTCAKFLNFSIITSLNLIVLLFCCFTFLIFLDKFESFALSAFSPSLNVNHLQLSFVYEGCYINIKKFIMLIPYWPQRPVLDPVPLSF